MPRSLQRALPPMEVNRVDRRPEPQRDVVNKVDHLKALALPLAMAKAQMGAAVEQAIGDAPLKEFGDKGSMSKVVTGEKVPYYLARICQDQKARRRLALALLKDDADVTVTTTITFPDEKVG